VPGSRKFLPQWCKEHVKPHNKSILVRVENSDPVLKYQQKIPLRKGEMVIWSSGNVHCNFPNYSSKMRLMQFARMMPALMACQDRDRFCCRRILRAFPDELTKRNVQLTELGSKLMGLVPWNDEVAAIMTAYDQMPKGEKAQDGEGEGEEQLAEIPTM